MKIGVFPGKFLPPHRGHLTGIMRAHGLCDKLYVAISERVIEDKLLCEKAGIPYITGRNRFIWLSKELEGMNIEIKLIDESVCKPFPDGWGDYANLVRESVNEKIDIVFGGETSYIEGHKIHFPEAEYIVLDPTRSKWNISATEIRNNIYKHWEYMLGSARPFFTKKVLITGTESCGKSTLVKKLAKVFYTSWSEEAGREYQMKNLGMNGDLFQLEDFNRIGHIQYEQDLKALQSANKVCFFDTDAVVTTWFSKFFLDEVSSRIEGFIDPSKYDLVIALMPTVPFVQDGSRETGEGNKRIQNFNSLMKMYSKYGFDTSKFKYVHSDSYYARMEECIKYVEELI